MTLARSPELEFITRLARLRPSAADVARARTLAAGPIRWSRVETLAEHHGLVGLAQRSIAQHGIEVPHETAARLAAAAMSAAAGNLAKFARWRSLGERFERAGIPAMTLKGFHVVSAIYGDLGIRPVGDLDFLVRPADVARSVDALGGSGYYVSRRWHAALDNVGFAYAIAHTYELQLGASDGLAVDLHWHAGPIGQTLPTDELLASSQPFTLHDTIGRGAALPDLLALLVAHGHKSQWHRFRWVVDVAEGLALLDEDAVARMRRHLERLRLLPALAMVERLIADTWSAPTDAIGARQPTDVPDRALRHIVDVHERVQDVYQTHDARRPWRLLRERLAEHANLWAAIRAAARPSHQDWAALRLPPALRAGYVAVRPFRVLRDAAVRRPARHSEPRPTERAAGPAETTPRPLLPSDDTTATFVTAIYSSGPDSLLGGRGRGLPYYLPTLRNLASFGSPLVVFASQADVANIRAALAPMFPRLDVIPFELSAFEHYHAFLRWKAEYRASLFINDRNEVLCFLKAYWLASVSQRRPWGSERTYWIDAGLFHHGIFPERVGGVEQLARAAEERYYPHDPTNICNPSLRAGIVAATPPGRLFACAMPAASPMFAPEIVAQLLGRAADDPQLPTIREHVVGGIFGGFDADIQQLLQRFRALLGRAIAARAYTLEEQLFSLIFATDPERFAIQRFTTWRFHSPGERTSALDAEADSFYKIFTRLVARGAA